MINLLNTTEYPIILDGDENTITLGILGGITENVTRVYSENRFGDKVYIGMVTERSASSIRVAMSRYSYTGYGFPESVETDSATLINKLVVLSVRDWAEANRMPRGLVAQPF